MFSDAPEGKHVGSLAQRSPFEAMIAMIHILFWGVANGFCSILDGIPIQRSTANEDEYDSSTANDGNHLGFYKMQNDFLNHPVAKKN